MSYSDTILAIPPTAYWHLSESSGVTADDAASASSTYDGTYTPNSGGAWTGGTLGAAQSTFPSAAATAAQFNGSTGYITVSGLQTAMAAATKASIECLIYRSASGTKSLLGFSANSTSRFGISWDTDNNLYVVSEDGGGAAYGYVANAGTGWFHVVVIFDGALTGNANRLKLYVNKVQQSLTFAGVGVPATLASAVNLGNFLIGKFGTAFTSSGNRIGEVSIYNGVALTQAQIEANYDAAAAAVLPDAPTSLVAGTITATSVALSWNYTGTPTGFRIYYSVNSDMSGALMRQVLLADIATASASPLSPGTLYYCEVTAYNDDGESTASNRISFTSAAPALTVTGIASGGTYAFGAGTSHTFPLVNSGDATLTINQPEVSGTGFSITDSPADPFAVLDPAEESSVTVARAAGATSGALTITSDDPASPYVINLIGDAAVPATAIDSIAGARSGMSTDITRPMSTNLN